MKPVTDAVGRFALPEVRDAWYIACYSEDLKNIPLARQLFGSPLVLFRDAAGAPCALLDRCAHRNVPLSMGQVVRGKLQCAYHGWQYDGDGICRFVPALCGAAEGKARRVNHFATREQQGFVWIYGRPDAAPSHEPYLFDGVDQNGVYAMRYDYRFEGSLLAVAENILDVPHTAFLHRGLFRTSSATTRRIKTVVRRTTHAVEAHYMGEPPPGVIGKVLAPGGGVVNHVDRFVLPCLAQVEYSLGAHRVRITDALTPVDDFVTQMHTVVTLELPGASLLGRTLAPIARHIAKQDFVMLQQQTATVQRFGGEQFVSTDVDVLGTHILRLLRQAERGEIDMAAPPRDLGEEPAVELAL